MYTKYFGMMTLFQGNPDQAACGEGRSSAGRGQGDQGLLQAKNRRGEYVERVATRCCTLRGGHHPSRWGGLV